MKEKPNINQFNLKKDPSDFLNNGHTDIIDNVPALDKNNKIHREQKVFRLSLELINALKRESYERSVKSGSRITETDLVEKALRLFLKI